MRAYRWLSGLALISRLFATVYAATPPAIDFSARQVVPGNVHPLAHADAFVSAADAALPMERITLALRPSPERQAALKLFLIDQHDPASPDFRHWLTPEEFGARFGPLPADVARASGWLASQGFMLDEVARSGMWIQFTGTAASVEKAFQTRINHYVIHGQFRVANAQDPAIPVALRDVVVGPVTLHNVPSRSMLSRVEPNYTSGSFHALTPGDFATIYNLAPLYAAGLDGTGQSIAIVARTRPSSTNWATFRSSFGLPANAPQVIVNGPDPGDLGAGENGEADLDVEWSGAVAKGATIKFVVSKGTNSADGVDLSASYIVNNNLAPVMSMSYGLCEADMGATNRAFYNTLWSQAAAQGISVFVSSGDSGAATCDSSDASTATRGVAVNGMASTPYNVAVGGSQFNEGSGSYWNSANASNGSSARSYIPEIAWNESGAVSGGHGLWSTGGGQSAYYSKPSWQVAPGVTADGTRDLPDVALTAAAHDGYAVFSQGSLFFFSGTSAAAPSFAGIMALIVQKTGQRQGNPNPRLYQLGNAQYSTGLPAVFHDITSGNNAVPGSRGYVATAGYDVVTGLGSVDATALANNWAGTAASCAYTLSSPSRSVGSAAASDSVSVTTANGCAWAAVSNATWLSITSGASQTGSGPVFYALAANTSTSTRTGSLTIAGLAFQVTQRAINSYIGTPANDNFVGATGLINTVVFTGSYTQYVVTVNALGVAQVQDTVASRDGTDSLTSIQRLQFTDQNIALDLNGANSAGGIYRLYAATFNRTPDLAGLGYWILQSDQGQSASTMAANFVFSAEFQKLYNVTIADSFGSGVNISTLVTGFYQNILHRAPDPAGLAFYAGQITSHGRSIGQVLAELSDSAENYAQVATQIKNGIVYTPWHN